MKSLKRVIITGGPGTGKTSVLSKLSHLGYPTHEEISRKVIREEQLKNSEILPWRDLSGFSDRVFKAQVEQYHAAQGEQINFYDRSIIDVIAYLKKDRLPFQSLAELVPQYPYETQVFLMPPWPGIYRQDAERRENLASQLTIHNALAETYHSFDYQVIEVPKLNIGQRAEHILKELGIA